MTNIKVKSQAILRNHMRFGIAKEFPTIWDFARLCSFIRLKDMALYDSVALFAQKFLKHELLYFLVINSSRGEVPFQNT